MDTNKIREDCKQGKPVDVGPLLDKVDRLTATVADLSARLEAALKKIDELTKKSIRCVKWTATSIRSDN